MEIKVIEDNSQYPKKTICLHCGSVLEYEEEDIIDKSFLFETGIKIKKADIFCPVCSKSTPIDIYDFIEQMAAIGHLNRLGTH